MEMVELGALNALVKLIGSDRDGVAAAAAQTARNIYVLDVPYRRVFKQLGGCKALVKLLDLRAGASPGDLQLEALYHLDDFIVHNASEVPDCVAAAKALGATQAVSRLANDQSLQETHPDIVAAAKHLFLRLAD